MKDCGECTLCCKLLELHEIPSAIGTYCEKCSPGKGCTIHNALQPKECKDYHCMWLQMNVVAEALRPDKCGIIFDKISSDVITARLEESLKLNDLLIGQINSFVNEGFSVLIFRGNSSSLFLNQSHTKEYVLEVANGSSKLY